MNPRADLLLLVLVGLLILTVWAIVRAVRTSLAARREAHALWVVRPRTIEGGQRQLMMVRGTGRNREEVSYRILPAKDDGDPYDSEWILAKQDADTEVDDWNARLERERRR